MYAYIYVEFSFYSLADAFLQIVFVLFWASSAMGTLVYGYIHGIEFVDIPRLIHTAEKEKIS